MLALLLQLQQHFQGTLTDEQVRAIAAEQGRAITYDNRGLYKKLNLWFWKHQFFNSYQINTFIVDVFVHPPTQIGSLLNANSLSY